ncbi:hypothetical protein PHSY_005074 [Pseudozyma hubeiensis SY62]|uniref:Uncharacterized protein n=1 Tax=Pseudozyma hubeiensis (strain SY62) TaxID=1305764 RepID=R9P7W1_PSEHS|nr:hypothetical protein PHSY_005074 [Pseudozyma hubeiensis SY62]GAC97488.1 hypothetical protein PHSY_005074 [Pseudozyma hubeiensis SY62]
MNFNSQTRDDPHGVQRLLDILRRQQDASSSAPASSSSAAAPPPPSAAAASAYSSNPFSLATSSSSVQPPISPVDAEVDAAQRRRTYNTTSSKYGVPASSDEPFDPYSFNPFSASAPVLSTPPVPAPQPKPAPSPSPPKPRDLSALSFSEALPILSTLSTDTSLLNRIRILRRQQHDLEQRLVKEYRQFAATADKQYPNPKARRTEDERRRKEMLGQWDECVRNQQEELKRAGVPAVKVTRDKRELDKQRKVLNVLVEMVDDDGGDG